METKIYNNNNYLLNYFNKNISQSNNTSSKNNSETSKNNSINNNFNNIDFDNNKNSNINNNNVSVQLKLENSEEIITSNHKNPNQNNNDCFYEDNITFVNSIVNKDSNQGVVPVCVDSLKKRRNWQKSLSELQMANYSRITTFNNLFNFDSLPCGCLLCEKELEFPKDTEFKIILMFSIYALVEFKKQRINFNSGNNNVSTSMDNIGNNINDSDNEIHQYVHLMHIREYIELHRYLFKLTPTKREKQLVNTTLNDNKFIFKSGVDVFGARGYYKLSNDEILQFIKKNQISSIIKNKYQDTITNNNNHNNVNNIKDEYGNESQLQNDNNNQIIINNKDNYKNSHNIDNSNNNDFNNINKDYNNKKKRKIGLGEDQLFVPNIEDGSNKFYKKKNKTSNINNNNFNNNENQINNHLNNINMYINNNNNTNNINNNNSNNNNSFTNNFQNINNPSGLPRSFSISSILNDYF